MPRFTFRCLSGVAAVFVLALLGAQLSDARVGTVPPAYAHRQPPPSLLARSHHRLYLDQKALRDQFYSV